MINFIDFLTKIIKNDTNFNFVISNSKVKEYDYSIVNSFKIMKENNFKIDDLIKLIVRDYELYKIVNVGNYFNIILKNNFYLKYLEVFKNTNINKKNKKILIDYSSPNVAKEMHVGHLRSTIIGDSIANFLEFYGYDILRINHIGDFGLQFGKIINYILLNNLEEKLEDCNLQELYELSNKMAKEDAVFLEQSQIKTYELQNKINPTYNIHQKICNISRKHFQENYSILGINKNLSEIPESFYQEFIPDMLKELKEYGLLEVEDDRIIIKTKLGKKDGALTLVKSNGGYTYDTTDLCAIKYRSQILKADKILYVVDTGQSEHFQQIFQVAEKLNWIKKNQAIHINFGIIQGEDGQRIRSRDGSTLKLLDFLNESISETNKVIMQKNNINDNDLINKLAIGSLKYADLKNNRTNDYRFSYEKILSFTGNTLTYIMYGYIRVKKILEKRNFFNDIVLDFNELNEKDTDLLKQVFKINDEYKKVDDNYEIHHLCTYLYDLTEKIHNCYKNNRVFDFDSDNKIININKSRIQIFNMVYNNFVTIFKILNIEPLEYM
jgi:arginyl-tRNA synthetase